MKHWALALIVGLSGIVLFAFQNCSKGFVAAKVQDLKSNSQCKAQFKAEGLRQDWSQANLRCDDLTNYICERRIFSPEIETMSHALNECIPGTATCVSVDVRQFNTSGARNPANAAAFEVGSMYNREEVNCHHSQLFKGVAVFSADADSLEEALSKAIKACERAAEGT